MGINRTHICLKLFEIQQKNSCLFYKTYICEPFPKRFKKHLFYNIPQQLPIRNPTKQVAGISRILFFNEIMYIYIYIYVAKQRDRLCVIKGLLRRCSPRTTNTRTRTCSHIFPCTNSNFNDLLFY